jgi:Fe-S-cluster containining protein
MLRRAWQRRLRLPLNMPGRKAGASAGPAVEEVRDIYRELASRPIERDCQLRTQCCHFKLTGKTPYLTWGEAVLAARALKATGRTGLPKRKDGACPLLDDKTERCLIYESRPFGCRTHFCAAAGGPYERRAVVDLIRRLEAIDEQLGGDGPHALPQALATALARPV